jgi:hypothetical protein
MAGLVARFVLSKPMNEVGGAKMDSQRVTPAANSQRSKGGYERVEQGRVLNLNEQSPEATALQIWTL